ncbi:MAG: PAS domain-containing protein [Bacteroidales bacterium]|nr:PAS domain-containing protein [Bacteroidales bacterium]
MMTQALFISLLQNTAILISAVLLYDYFWIKGDVTKRWYDKVLAGLSISLIGSLLMLTPWSASEGLFFDTRSILLSISGVFLGPLPTIIASLLLALYRFILGGPGMWMGVTVILTAGSIGIAWGLFIRRRTKRIGWLQLWLIGLNVHLVMLLCTLLLPSALFLPTLKVMIFPILIVYPLGFTLMGLVMLRRNENWGYRQKLVESKALYTSLVNHMPAGVFRKTKDGRYVYVNQRFCELKGLTEEEILGKDPQELAAYEAQKDKSGGYLTEPVQRTMVKQGTDHHEWILRHGMPIVVEEAYTHRDGHVDYFQVVKTPILDPQGNVIGSQGMQFDITQHKRTEEALLAEQYLLNAFMDNTPDLVYFKDAESRIIRFNKAYLRAQRATDERAILGKTDFDFFTAEHAKKAFEDEQSIMRTGEPLINIEEKETWQDGRVTWSLTSKFPSRNKEGVITGTFGVSRDITAQKLLEQELIAAKIKAEESDRLKTAFLHNISHEIRTPMNAIMGFSGFLSDPDMSEEQKTHFAQVIQQSSQQLLSIIDDIVRIATIEAGQEKLNENELHLNNLLVFLREQFAAKAGVKNLSFEMMPGLDDDRSLIIADETKLMQILSNLLENAIKFTREGQVLVGYTLKHGQLEFFVKDTGIGIPESMHETIFNRFSQVESSISRQFGGSGLGLSISKAYVDLQGGKIWVESEPGEGSSFYFTLPYRHVSRANNRSDVSPITLQTEEGQGTTFLVAEDEDLNFMLVRELLRKFEVKIIRAINGAEAVEIARTTKVDLVLMDLKMPVMDGFEATRAIKSFQPDLPILALTAYSLEADRVRALQSGCADVIVKPINREHLYERLNAYLG